MTLPESLPEIVAEPVVRDWIVSRCTSPDSLPDLERAARTGAIDDPFLDSAPWSTFRRHARALWKIHDHVILRGVPAAGNGASLILLSLLLCRRFKIYRGDRVVKHFRMSPWTTDLSHTLQEGHFHTDLNTAAEPPRVTAIQCRVPDPGGPRYSELRVARLEDLIRRLHQSTASAGTLAFLQQTCVTMVNDSAAGGWTGCIVEGDNIRFHPETLRAAQRRYGSLPVDFEDHLQRLKEAALAVARPFQLGEGDALLVSNTRALHYRGACSVVFRTYPRDFVSREVDVLHLMDEPE